MPRRMKLCTHVDSGWIYCVFQNQTVRPRRLKLGTHVDNGHIYCVNWNQAAAAYSSL